MKRLLSILICMILLVSSLRVIAEEVDTTFDNTQFEGCVGYKYTKLDKKYRYDAEYERKFSDGVFHLEFIADGEKNHTGKLWMAVYLYMTIEKEYQNIDSLSILVDEDLYTFDNLIVEKGGFSYALFGYVGIEMINALSKAKEIALRAHITGKGKIDLEPEIKEFSSIITWADRIVSSSYVDKMDKLMFESYDLYFKADKE